MNIENDLFTKVDLTQFSKIYDQLTRFAEYKDLKSLHAFLTGETIKFEKRLIDG